MSSNKLKDLFKILNILTNEKTNVFCKILCTDYLINKLLLQQAQKTFDEKILASKFIDDFL